MLMGQKLLLLDTRTLIFSWQSKKVSPEGPKCDEMRGVLGNPKGWGSPKTILWCVDRASPSSGLPCQLRVSCFRCAFWATISYLLRAGGGSLWVAVFRVIRGENNPCLADCLQSAALHWKNTFCFSGSCPGFHTTLQRQKNKCHPQNQQRLAQGMRFSWQCSSRVWEKRAAVLSPLPLAYFLGKEVHVPNNQNEWEHQCSALLQCTWAAGFSPILSWGTWAAERTGGENEE